MPPRPIDDLLFDAIHAHSMRTRGQPAKRVTLQYEDGSETALSLPTRAELMTPDATGPQENAPALIDCRPAVWPPEEGWAFRPGEAAFNGTRFKLGGKLLAILRELADRAGEPVTADRLKRIVWGEEPDMVEDGNLQGHISLLRKKLRDALGLDRGYDPIPHADGAYRLAAY